MSIKVFTTGGTIDKIYFDANSEFQVGDPQISRALQEAQVGLEIEIEPILRKDSLDLLEEDRQLIRAFVEREPANHILLTHGTDTMIQTALWLEQIPGKTIVLTGALQPASLRVSDAFFNIGFALAAVQLLAPGVYIAMHGRVFDPCRTIKNRTLNRFEEQLPEEP